MAEGIRILINYLCRKKNKGSYLNRMWHCPDCEMAAKRLGIT